MGTVEEIYIASSGSAPMIEVDEIAAVASAGLAGDRYLTRTGYWTGVDECQVTLIEGESLDHIRTTTEVDVDNGRHRRNIVTHGIRLQEQSVSEHRMTRALGGGRGGICARVAESGRIRVGDTIEVVPEVHRSARATRGGSGG
jgi:MOSC domain-containing protein YiiM